MKSTTAPWLVVLIGLVALPLMFQNPIVVPILNQIGIAIIFSMSYNMVLGQTGLLSFAHAVFFGFGGFATVNVLRLAGAGDLLVPVPLVPVFGALSGLAMAVLLGSFTSKRVGMAFAMITMCLVELVLASAILFGRFYGGSFDRTQAPTLFGLDFQSDISVYYLITVWLSLSILGMAAYARSPLGRMANAVRDNAARAEFIGYNTRIVRFAALSASGLFAGIAGSLFAVAYEFVGGEVISAATSGNVIIMTYIGGIGHFAGPILGAVVLTLLQTLLSNYTGIWGFYVGLVFVATVVFAPHGLAGVISAHLTLRDSKAWRPLLWPYALSLAGVVLTAMGVIGTLEMVSFLNEAGVGETRLGLAGLSLNTASSFPWIGFGVLITLGGLILRRSLPAAHQAWRQAVEQH
mgnify:CR=1 FL=1